MISDQAKRQLAVWFEAGVGTAALLFFPVLVVVPRGAAALVSAAGLCAAGLVFLARGFELRPLFARAAAVLACLLVWAMVSALWSPDPGRSLALVARLAGILAAGLALVSVVTGGLAVRRSAGRIGTGNGSLGAIVALAAALIALVNGGLNLAMATGGPGTGNGVVGAAAALVLGLIGMALGGLALARSRRTV